MPIKPTLLALAYVQNEKAEGDRRRQTDKADVEVEVLGCMCRAAPATRRCDVFAQSQSLVPRKRGLSYARTEKM